MCRTQVLYQERLGLHLKGQKPGSFLVNVNTLVKCSQFLLSLHNGNKSNNNVDVKKMTNWRLKLSP